MLGLLSLRQDGPRLGDEEIVLRSPKPSDFEAWAALRAESRAFLEPWEPRWARDELSLAAWRQRLRRYRHDQATGSALPLFIFGAESGCLAGGITVTNIRYGVAQNASIGYWMGERFAGRGLMPRALRLVAGHCFETMRLHRLEAACIPDNNRSIRVLEKAGFSREGLLRSYLKINGAWQDHYLYARVSDHAANERS